MTDMDYSKIDLLVLDVDGVMTDGRIVLAPDGDEVKFFHVRDGSGIKYWKRVGKKVAIISGRGSPAVTRRAKELDIDICRLNIKNKLPVFEEVVEELDVPADRVAVMGDDLTDIPMLRACGYPVVVSDGAEEAAQFAKYVTSRRGGDGAVREVIERILKGAGLWDRIMARYLTSNEDESE